VATHYPANRKPATTTAAHQTGPQHQHQRHSHTGGALTRRATRAHGGMGGTGRGSRDVLPGGVEHGPGLPVRRGGNHLRRREPRRIVPYNFNGRVGRSPGAAAGGHVESYVSVTGVVRAAAASCAPPPPGAGRRAPGAGRRAERPGDTRTAWGVRAKQASQAVGATRTQFAVCVGRTGQGGRGAARPRRL